MSKEPQNHEEPEELDLDAELVRDLDPEEDAEGVGGGALYQVTNTCHCILTIVNCYLP